MAKYLYNGVELPEIPAHSYAYEIIFKWTDSEGATYYKLHATSAQPYAADDPNGYGVKGIYADGPNTEITYKCYAGDAEWGEAAENSHDGQVTFGNAEALVWTNTDIIYNGDGSVFMAASDPVPVDGSDTDTTPNYNINWNVLLKGVEIGRRLKLARLNGESGEVYDDTWPIEWNAIVAGNNPSVDFDGMRFVKVSNIVATAEELEKSKLSITDDVQTTEGTLLGVADAGFGMYASYNLAENEFLVASVPQAGTFDGIIIPESGLYALDVSGESGASEVTFRLKTVSPIWFDSFPVDMFITREMFEEESDVMVSPTTSGALGLPLPKVSNLTPSIDELNNICTAWMHGMVATGETTETQQYTPLTWMVNESGAGLDCGALWVVHEPCTMSFTNNDGTDVYDFTEPGIYLAPAMVFILALNYGFTENPCHAVFATMDYINTNYPDAEPSS